MPIALGRAWREPASNFFSFLFHVTRQQPTGARCRQIEEASTVPRLDHVCSQRRNTTYHGPVGLRGLISHVRWSMDSK